VNAGFLTGHEEKEYIFTVVSSVTACITFWNFVSVFETFILNRHFVSNIKVVVRIFLM